MLNCFDIFLSRGGYAWTKVTPENRALVAAPLCGAFCPPCPCGAAEPAAAAELRSGLNNLFIFSKLREARSRLYRRQILQVTIRWKALDGIYKMSILLHRSKFQQRSRHNSGEHLLNENSIHSKIRNFDITIAILLLNFDENLSEFRRCVRKCQNSLRIAKKKCENSVKILLIFLSTSSTKF